MTFTNGLKTFAVLGHGTVGAPIIEAFLEAKLPLTILSRDASKPELQAYAQRGATLKTVDYSSIDSIAGALTGIDGFVSALGNQHAPSLPEDLVRAAKQAGVKLYVPSEWGLDYLSPRTQPLSPIVQAKVDRHAFIESQGLSWIAIANGGFGSFVVTPFLGWDLAQHKLTLRGAEDTPMSVTDTRDIGTFVVKVLTTQPVPAPGTGRVYQVEGYAATPRQILDELEKQSGHKFTIVKASYEEVQAKQTEPSFDGLLAWLSATFADGRAKLDNIDNDAVGFAPRFFLDEHVRVALANVAQTN